MPYADQRPDFSEKGGRTLLTMPLENRKDSKRSCHCLPLGYATPATQNRRSGGVQKKSRPTSTSRPQTWGRRNAENTKQLLDTFPQDLRPAGWLARRYNERAREGGAPGAAFLRGAADTLRTMKCLEPREMRVLKHYNVKPRLKP